MIVAKGLLFRIFGSFPRLSPLGGGSSCMNPISRLIHCGPFTSEVPSYFGRLNQREFQQSVSVRALSPLNTQLH